MLSAQPIRLAKFAWPDCQYRSPINAGAVLKVLLAGARHWSGRLIVVALAGLGGVSGPAAAAQAPSYQPDSPAGTEYAIPLDEARKTGSASDGAGAARRSSDRPTSGSASDANDQSALFGEGIAPAKKSSAAAGAAHRPSKTPAKTTRAASAEPPTARHIRPAASSISGTTVALGTGGLVLALGAALTGAAVLSRRIPRSR
jgi:hypothetical protein